MTFNFCISRQTWWWSLREFVTPIENGAHLTELRVIADIPACFHSLYTKFKQANSLSLLVRNEYILVSNVNVIQLVLPWHFGGEFLKHSTACGLSCDKVRRERGIERERDLSEWVYPPVALGICLLTCHGLKVRNNHQYIDHTDDHQYRPYIGSGLCHYSFYQ